MSVETVARPEVAEREKLPVWLPPVLGFIAGALLMYGVIQPINNTPDYQRGYDDGTSDEQVHSDNLETESFFRGLHEGSRLTKAGLPLPAMPPQQKMPN